MEIELRWEGEGPNERAFDKSGRVVVEVDPEFYRPAEVETLLGDPSKAREKLNWSPETSFDELVEEMALADLERFSKIID